jgi:hypothetical protein
MIVVPPTTWVEMNLAEVVAQCPLAVVANETRTEIEAMPSPSAVVRLLEGMLHRRLVAADRLMWASARRAHLINGTV